MMRMFRIQTLNRISQAGLSRLPADRYEVSETVEAPDALLVRSANLHEREMPPTLLAVGRAGAGVNNIPVAALTARGIPVFNTPGANANAVKELVVAGLILGCRRLGPAWDFARAVTGTDDEISRAIEAGKKQFAGFELPGRRLGVIGLGAIGRQVANAGVSLGMQVSGFDPGLTVEGAWQLSAAVRQARSLDELVAQADFVSVHVPLTERTRHLIDSRRLAAMPRGAILLNFAREAIVDERAVVDALEAGHLDSYVCDFPTTLTRHHPRCVTLPHLGASTAEAEEHCAVMVVDELRDFLEHGHVRHAVNFPDVQVVRATPHRLVCANRNVPAMLGRISDVFGRAGLNIHDMVNMSRGELAYTLVDLDAPVAEDTVDQIAAIDGVLMTRRIDPPQP